MGVVFRARDTKLDRDVALKLWNLPGEKAEAAVLHEAQCLAKLSHPNVVALYETGKVGADLFLTMELVRGMDGREWLNRFFPTWEEVVDLHLAAGRGLAAAHAAGLEHGDFKPENVLLGLDQRVRVADFGVARALRDQIDAGEDGVTGADSGRLGTLSYMAPERLQGRAGDARSDQFSFCVCVWEALYGARPFGGETAVVLLEAMELGRLQVGVKVDGIPRRLRGVITKGLSVKPSDRWPDMRSLLAALGDIRERAKQRRIRMRVGIVAAGLVAGSSLTTAAMFVRARRPPLVDVRSAAPIVPLSSQPGEAPRAGQANEDVDSSEIDPAANVVPEVVTLIEAGDFDGAYSRWVRAQLSPWRTKVPIADEALLVAQAFYDQALLVEHLDHESASIAARHAASAAGYASANFDSAGVEQRELAELIGECTRLTSRVTRLLGEFSDTLAQQASFSCACEHTNGTNCHQAPHGGPARHACLAALIVGQAEVVLPHLECVVPVMEAYGACVATTADCNSRALAGCLADRERETGACPRLSAELERGFADCNR